MAAIIENGTPGTARRVDQPHPKSLHSMGPDSPHPEIGMGGSIFEAKNNHPVNPLSDPLPPTPSLNDQLTDEKVSSPSDSYTIDTEDGELVVDIKPDDSARDH